jgi:hypothetical protein
MSADPMGGKGLLDRLLAKRRRRRWLQAKLDIVRLGWLIKTDVRR